VSLSGSGQSEEFMKRIILNIAVTLDGLIEGPQGELDWLLFDDDVVDSTNEFLHEVDSILYGRKAYEIFGKQSSTPSSSEGQREFAETVNAMTKYVFSRSMRGDGEAIVVDGDIAAEVARIKAQPGKDIWLCGGATIVTALANLGLIDEYRLDVHPVVLGAGSRCSKAKTASST
jgi:dihydrofolate reductase